MTEYVFHYDEERENHVDEEGRTLAEVLEDNPEEYVAEPPHYDQIDLNTGIPQRETVVTAVEGEDEAPEVEPEAEGDGYDYSYNDEEEVYECNECEFTTDVERGMRGHYTQVHSEEEEG